MTPRSSDHAPARTPPDPKGSASALAEEDARLRERPAHDGAEGSCRGRHGARGQGAPRRSRSCRQGGGPPRASGCALLAITARPGSPRRLLTPPPGALRARVGRDRGARRTDERRTCRAATRWRGGARPRSLGRRRHGRLRSRRGHRRAAARRAPEAARGLDRAPSRNSERRDFGASGARRFATSAGSRCSNRGTTHVSLSWKPVCDDTEGKKSQQGLVMEGARIGSRGA